MLTLQLSMHWLVENLEFKIKYDRASFDKEL